MYWSKINTPSVQQCIETSVIQVLFKCNSTQKKSYQLSNSHLLLNNIPYVKASS